MARTFYETSCYLLSSVEFGRVTSSNVTGGSNLSFQSFARWLFVFLLVVVSVCVCLVWTSCKETPLLVRSSIGATKRNVKERIVGLFETTPWFGCGWLLYYYSSTVRPRDIVLFRTNVSSVPGTCSSSRPIRLGIQQQEVSRETKRTCMHVCTHFPKHTPTGQWQRINATIWSCVLSTRR